MVINSVKLKLIAIYAGVLLIVMTVSGTFMLFDFRNTEIERTRSLLETHARRIVDNIIQIYDRDNFINAAAWDILAQSEYEIEGMILSNIGRPIAPEAYIGLQISDRSIINAIEGSEWFDISQTGPALDGSQKEWLVYARPVIRDGETFIIYTRIESRFMNESLSRLALTLVMMILIALVLTLVFWFFIGNTLTNPITALSKHARAIAAGDFSRDIEVGSQDEIGQLAANFNHMAKELKETLNNMASEKNKSEAILQNTSHGVLAYDASGKLIHVNNASIELLSGIDLEVVIVSDILTMLGFTLDEINSLQPEEILEATYEDGDAFILSVVTAYKNQNNEVDGFILVLQDISRQMKLDNMRKEFVANVSHELRTPLTTIRTYTETLLDGAMEDAEMSTKFLKTIDDEAQRMTLLISDLLELSRIDSQATKLELDVVDLVALIKNTVRSSNVLAEQKEQAIIVDVPTNPCFIEANALRITQVLNNLFSNAIKYSPENTEIKVYMETTEKFYRVFIKDQGMGIPAESLPRIFERFYRVDKARARAMGGTGLGLAIVKEIMEEHGGTVHASSVLGQGTTMVLRFKRYSP